MNRLFLSVFSGGFALMLLAGAAHAQPAAEQAKPRFSLTIYSMASAAHFDPTRGVRLQRAAAEVGYYEPLPGFGIVREIRRIPLKQGANTIKFTDVAAEIDPTTVSFKSLTAPDSTTVLEQNFEYDLMSPQKLLEKYIGQNIIINRKQPPVEGEKVVRPETIEARLLACTDKELVLQTNNKQLPVQIVPRTADIQEIKLFDLATGLITQPTLVWRLSTDKAGDHDVLVSYQTENITWRADYNLSLSPDEKKADLSAWVTVVNESGAAFPDAKLKLVAGDVQRLKSNERTILGGGRGGGRDEPEFKEKDLFEYHLYTLGRTTSIANNATKQIELFPLRANVPVEKIYLYDGRPGKAFAGYAARPMMDGDGDEIANTKVNVFLKLRNTQANGLGIPMPAGRMRTYKRDTADADDLAGTLEFVGEDKIDHTPRDESIQIGLGNSFDVVGQRTKNSFLIDNNNATETFEIKVRNHKKEPIKVQVREVLHRWPNWEITAKSDNFEKKDDHTIIFPVEIAPGQEKTITYTVRYAWKGPTE